MLKRPWPAPLHPPVAPAPACINPSFGAYDPDAGRYGRRRRISPIALAAIMVGAFLFLTIGLRPAVGVFVGLAEMAGRL